jgi:hypothetical protein
VAGNPSVVRSDLPAYSGPYVCTPDLLKRNQKPQKGGKGRKGPDHTIIIGT